MEPEEEQLASPDNQTLKIRRSLNVLTTGFLKLLEEAEDGELDLRHAVKSLGVKHKRRVYDITNVLQGIGLIAKKSKNIVKWIGDKQANVYNSAYRLKQLKSELEDLRLKEFALDQQKMWVEQSIETTTEDCSGLTYVNHEDIGSCFKGHTLLAVQAPSGTQMDVPIPKAVQNSPPKYQVHLKSIKGPIDVTLLGKESSSSDLVVFPVPPSEEILQRAKLAMSASYVTDGSRGSCWVSPYTRHSSKSKWAEIKDSQPQPRSSCGDTEVSRSLQSALEDLEEQLNQMQHTKERKNTNVIPQPMSSEVCSPYLSDHDYSNKLEKSESISDLFNLPALGV